MKGSGAFFKPSGSGDSFKSSVRGPQINSTPRNFRRIPINGDGVQIDSVMRNYRRIPLTNSKPISGFKLPKGVECRSNEGNWDGSGLQVEPPRERDILVFPPGFKCRKDGGDWVKFGNGLQLGKKAKIFRLL